MTTYQTLLPVSDLLRRGEAILPGELIGFDSTEGVQWGHFSRIEAGIVCLRLSPDVDSPDDPAMLADHCFIQRPAILVIDVVTMLKKNLTDIIKQMQAE